MFFFFLVLMSVWEDCIHQSLSFLTFSLAMSSLSMGPLKAFIISVTMFLVSRISFWFLRVPISLHILPIFSWISSTLLIRLLISHNYLAFPDWYISMSVPYLTLILMINCFVFFRLIFYLFIYYSMAYGSFQAGLKSELQWPTPWLLKCQTLNSCTRPGIEPETPPWPEPLLRQHQILNLLHYSGNSKAVIFFFLIEIFIYLFLI